MHKRTTIWIMTSLLLVLVGSFLVLQDDISRVWARSQAQPQDYTQLAFMSPLALPRKATPGQPQTVSFWLHNNQLSGKTVEYEVYQEDATRREIIQSGSLLMRASQRTVTSFTLVSTEGLGRQKIVVHIPSLRQEIHFWLEGTQS